MSITRRALMIAGGVAGGGLVLGVATMGAWIATYDRRAEQREQLAERGAKLVAQWLMIDTEGHVTILSPHIEMGQGAVMVRPVGPPHQGAQIGEQLPFAQRLQVGNSRRLKTQIRPGAAAMAVAKPIHQQLGGLLQQLSQTRIRRKRPGKGIKALLSVSWRVEQAGRTIVGHSQC